MSPKSRKRIPLSPVSNAAPIEDTSASSRKYPSRRAKGRIQSMAEPSLRRKLRKGDPHTFNLGWDEKENVPARGGNRFPIYQHVAPTTLHTGDIWLSNEGTLSRDKAAKRLRRKRKREEEPEEVTTPEKQIDAMDNTRIETPAMRPHQDRVRKKLFRNRCDIYPEALFQ